MNFNLTEEQKLIKKTAREFALKELAPKVIERDEKKLHRFFSNTRHRSNREFFRTSLKSIKDKMIELKEQTNK